MSKDIEQQPREIADKNDCGAGDGGYVEWRDASQWARESALEALKQQEERIKEACLDGHETGHHIGLGDGHALSVWSRHSYEKENLEDWECYESDKLTNRSTSNE